MPHLFISIREQIIPEKSVPSLSAGTGFSLISISLMENYLNCITQILGFLTFQYRIMTCEARSVRGLASGARGQDNQRSSPDSESSCDLEVHLPLRSFFFFLIFVKKKVQDQKIFKISLFKCSNSEHLLLYCSIILFVSILNILDTLFSQWALAEALCEVLYSVSE